MPPAAPILPDFALTSSIQSLKHCQARNTSHITHHTSHVTRHTSHAHVTHHTSHITHQKPHITVTHQTSSHATCMRYLQRLSLSSTLPPPTHSVSNMRSESAAPCKLMQPHHKKDDRCTMCVCGCECCFTQTCCTCKWNTRSHLLLTSSMTELSKRPRAASGGLNERLRATAMNA